MNTGPEKDKADFLSMFGFDRRTLSGGLTPARNCTMLALLGLPRSNFDAECRDIQNRALSMMVTSMDVGPFRATGMWHALQQLARAFRDLWAVRPDLHDRLGLAELLCCRLAGNSRCVISNHAWGAAVDVTFDGGLDPALHPKIRPDLLEVARIMTGHGFFWGAAYPAEDALHFEVSEQLVRRWAREGHFGQVPFGVPAGLTIGDRGIDVEILQRRLNQVLAPCTLTVDGAFGPLTRAAVMEYQRRFGFRVDGIASNTIHLSLAHAYQERLISPGA